jgi:hypothetical protein
MTNKKTKNTSIGSAHFERTLSLKELRPFLTENVTVRQAADSFMRKTVEEWHTTHNLKPTEVRLQMLEDVFTEATFAYEGKSYSKEEVRKTPLLSSVDWHLKFDVHFDQELKNYQEEKGEA